MAPSKFNFASSVTTYLAILYLLIMAIVLYQIARIIYYRHSKLSFQFGFLVLSLCWSAGRSFFFLLYPYWSLQAPSIGIALYWIGPYFQFATFLFLVLFYISIAHHNTWVRWTKRAVALIYFALVAIILAIFTVTTVLANVQLRVAQFPYSWLNIFRSAFSAFIYLVLVSILTPYALRVRQLLSVPATPLRQLQGISPARLSFAAALIFVTFFTRATFDIIGIFLGVFLENYFCFLVRNATEDIIVAVLYIFFEVAPFSAIVLLFWRIPSSCTLPLRRMQPAIVDYSHVQEENVSLLHNDESCSPFTRSDALTFQALGVEPYDTTSPLND